MILLQLLAVTSNTTLDQDSMVQIIGLQGRDRISIMAINHLIQEIGALSSDSAIRYSWHCRGAETVLLVPRKWADPVQARILSDPDLEAKSDSLRSWGTYFSQSKSGVILEGPGIADIRYDGVRILDLLSKVNISKYSLSDIRRTAIERRSSSASENVERRPCYDLFMEFFGTRSSSVLRAQFSGSQVISQSWVKSFPLPFGSKMGNVGRPY